MKMKNIINIINYIIDWQNENDKEFKPVPIDDHSKIIFNINNQQIYSFTFSSRFQRRVCYYSIPVELLEEFNYIEEQDNDIVCFM